VSYEQSTALLHHLQDCLRNPEKYIAMVGFGCNRFGRFSLLALYDRIQGDTGRYTVIR